MVLKKLVLFLLLFLVKNVFLQNNDTKDYKTRPVNVIGGKYPFFVRVELPLEIRAALYALKNSISHLQNTKREIIEEVERALEKKLKVYDLELKSQFAKTKQEIIVETDQNVEQRLTETKNEIIVQMNAFADSTKTEISKSDNLILGIKSSIKEEFQEMTANTFSALDEIKKQLNSIEETEQNIKQQLIQSNNDNVMQIRELNESVTTVYSETKKKLTKEKVEIFSKINTLSESTESYYSKTDKRIGEIESIIQTQLHEIKDLGNDLIKTKQEIINETKQSHKEQFIEAKNAIVVQLSSLEESTKLAISKSENFTSEMQSNIKSQFKEMETAFNNAHDLNDIKNQLTAINETEKYVKEQLSETQNKILVLMNELRESRITVCSDIKNNLSQTKNEMVDQMKTIFSQSEKPIAELQSYMQTLVKEIKNEVNLSRIVSEIENKLTKAQNEIITEIEECKNPPSDCKDVQRRGYNTSGIYRIQPMLSLKGFSVWCDMSTQGGGWTYVINRFNGSQNFNRNWTDYKQGFGNVSGEHWLGLDRRYELTNSRNTELLFELVDWNLKKVYARYNTFQVGSESESFYIKSLGTYHGDAGDSFRVHSKAPFSTTDHDHNNTCAKSFKGAWWYTNCYHVDLSGKHIYSPIAGNDYRVAIHWKDFHGYHYSLKEARMMIRPLS